MLSSSVVLAAAVSATSNGLVETQQSLTADPAYRAEVLGPLEPITDWNGFARDLLTMKGIGAEAMATDVWWGQVETSRGVYNWSYFDQLSAAIINAGLKWIPIMSTHQCGGYNQACNIPVPAWSGLATNPAYQFFDIHGNADTEAFSPWSGPEIYQIYSEYYQAFASHYQGVAQHVPRVDLSGGASGELRYPSYSLNWNYPARGELQAYGASAVQSFQGWVMSKYGNNFGTISQAWGRSVKSINDIYPPCHTTTQSTSFGPCAGKTGQDTFFSQEIQSTYGQDFGTWYQGSLIEHSASIANVAHQAFDNVFTTATIAMKFSGVHWQYFSPTEPHSAEYAVGYWSYNVLLSAMKAQGLEGTFTAMEQDDGNSSPTWSAAHTLPVQFYTVCAQVGLTCGGENALDIGGSGGDAYHNMRGIMSSLPVASLTFLRYNDLTQNLGNLQAYATYVSTIVSQKVGIFFQVSGISTPSNSAGLAVIGNVPELGSGSIAGAFMLYPYSCNNNQCTWIGTAKIANAVNSNVKFSLAVMGPGSGASAIAGALVQCASPYNLYLSTNSANAVIGQGNGQSTNDGIATYQFNAPQLNCPVVTVTTTSGRPTTTPLTIVITTTQQPDSTTTDITTTLPDLPTTLPDLPTTTDIRTSSSIGIVTITRSLSTVATTTSTTSLRIRTTSTTTSDSTTTTVADSTTTSSDLPTTIDFPTTTSSIVIIVPTTTTTTSSKTTTTTTRIPTTTTTTTTRIPTTTTTTTTTTTVPPTTTTTTTSAPVYSTSIVIITTSVAPPPTTTTVPVTTLTISPPTITSSPPVPTALPLVSFHVTHNTGFGSNLFIVGSFNNWDTCNAATRIPCIWNKGNLWICDSPPGGNGTIGASNGQGTIKTLGINPGQTYEFKPIQFPVNGCAKPVWKSGGNLAFTVKSASNTNFVPQVIVVNY